MSKSIISKDEKPAFRRNLLENDLRRQIKMRQGHFDEPLATEHTLAQNYQLSRNTIRKVLQKLQNEGLLTRKTGFGTYIVSPEQRPVSKVKLHRILLATNWPQTDYYVQRLVSGILEYTFMHSTTLDIVHYKTLSTSTMIANYRALKYDAVIHDRPSTEQYPMIKDLARLKVPQVTINRTVPCVPSLYVDHGDVVQQVTQFCFGLGLEHICFVDMPCKEPIFTKRQADFKNELVKYGIAHPEEYVYIYPEGKKAEAGFCNYIKKHPQINTFFIIRPFMESALNVLEAMQKKIPDDISVIMLDDDSRNPRFRDFTVFREPIQKLGFTAADILFHTLSNEPPEEKQTFLTGELVVRKTVRFPHDNPMSKE